MSFNLNEYYSSICQGNVLLAYKGDITSDIINDVLEAVELKLAEADEKGKTRKKLYNVLVESLQNLFHHIEENPDIEEKEVRGKFGVLVIEKTENDEYKVTTGNFINAEKEGFLKEKIDKINSLSRNELKDMYKFILNHQRLSPKGGGGLGLVDIARKTGKELTYKCIPYNDKYSFFDLKIKI